MKFKSNFDSKKINKGINKKIAKALETSCNYVPSALKKRIKRGVNADGGRFRALSKTTTASKSKRGRKAMFEDSGDMLRSLTCKSKDNTLKLFFDDGGENDKAYSNIYNHKRDFMDLSDKEINRVVGKIKDSLSNL